jgi:hypothetical protein
MGRLGRNPHRARARLFLLLVLLVGLLGVAFGEPILAIPYVGGVVVVVGWCAWLCMSCSDRAIAAGVSRTRTWSCGTRSDSQSAEAQALDTDTEPPEAHCARFASAVDQAWRCWRAARDAAERIRLSSILAEERIIVRRAIKLLTMAREFNHDTERTAAYAKVRTELAKLERSGTLALPPAAAAALSAAIRGQLPSARIQD